MAGRIDELLFNFPYSYLSLSFLNTFVICISDKIIEPKWKLINFFFKKKRINLQGGFNPYAKVTFRETVQFFVIFNRCRMWFMQMNVTKGSKESVNRCVYFIKIHWWRFIVVLCYLVYLWLVFFRKIKFHL